MISKIRKLLFGDCLHEILCKTEKRIWEHKCDCCGKVLFAKEYLDFDVCIKDTNISEKSDVLLMDA